MSAFRKIDPKLFAGLLSENLADPGATPTLKWLKISELVVDPTYQRDILGTGRKNIIKIASDFDWTKFSPVIVAPVGGGQFVIVDGQHRVTGAALRGIDKVPCQIIIADRKKQAEAFAAVNSAVTLMSPMQIHAAKVVAKDAHAIRLSNLCMKAGVTILRYPVQTEKQKVGETMAAGTLYSALRKFGDAPLMTALSCITRTRDGYPGMIRSQLISALCAVLEAEPAWSTDTRKLLRAMGKLDFRVEFSKAMKKAEGSRGGMVSELVDVISAHLDKELATVAA